MPANQRQYIDFKLYLTLPLDGRGACQIALLPTPEVGETITPVTVPIAEKPPDGSLGLLAAKQATYSTLVALGKNLANCLLPEGVVRDRFRAAYDQAGPYGGVRLRLVIGNHVLKEWPWEYAFYDMVGGTDSKSMLGFLALNPRISVIRHEPLPYPHPKLSSVSDDLTEIRMALISASPAGFARLNARKELASIHEALKDLDVEGVCIALDPVLPDATPDDLSTKIPKGTHIVHFAGHGLAASGASGGAPQDEGAILLVKDRESREEARVRASTLASILQAAGVRLAVLGACYSGDRQSGGDTKRYPWDGVGSALVAREIPAVIAMQYEINDEVAVTFARAFYRALASGLSLDEAMYFARRAMVMETGTSPDLEHIVNVEWGIPVLYSRLRDGALFPERMERAGRDAETFRSVMRQTAEATLVRLFSGQGGSVKDITVKGVEMGEGVSIRGAVNDIENKIVQGDYVDRQTITNNILVLGPQALEEIVKKIAGIQGIDKQSIQALVGDTPVPENVSRQIAEVAAAHHEVTSRGLSVSAEASYRMGMLAAYDRKYEDALEYFRQATASDPDYIDGYQAIAWLQQARAHEDLFLKKEPKSAAARLEEARKAVMHTDPIDPDALALRGYIAATLAQVAGVTDDRDRKDKCQAEAANLFARAVELNPTSPSALKGLATAKHEMGDLDGAISAYLRSIRLAPTYTSAHHDLAIAYEDKMDADPSRRAQWRQKALKSWQKAYEFAPKDPGFSSDYIVQGIGQRIDFLKQESRSDTDHGKDTGGKKRPQKGRKS